MVQKEAHTMKFPNFLLVTSYAKKLGKIKIMRLDKIENQIDILLYMLQEETRAIDIRIN